MNNLTLEALNLSVFTPMGVLLIGALLILCLDLIQKDLSVNFYTMITTIFLLVDLVAVLSSNSGDEAFFGLLKVDGVSIIAQSIVIVGALLFILLSIIPKKFNEFRFAEYFSLFLFSVVGFQFMVSSTNLILILLGLEIASLCIYILIAIHNTHKSIEAAIKFFTLGAISSSFFLLGIFVMYLLTSSIDLVEITARIQTSNHTLIILSLCCFLVSIGFKLSLVPFHRWVADVYDGSSEIMAGYISIVPKIAGIVIAYRIFTPFLEMNIEWLYNILYFIIVSSMLLSNIMAMVQNDVKRMLGYSSIGHSAFILAAILITNEQTLHSIFLYWSMFMFTNMGIFTVLWVSRNKLKKWHKYHDQPHIKFSGLIYSNPFLAIVFSVFMFSLAGIPPFALFWGKFYLIGTVVNSGEIYLALTMAVSGIMAVFYSLRLIVYILLKEPVELDGQIYITNVSWYNKFVMAMSAIVVFFSMSIIGGLLGYFYEILK
ncbi:MAG: NADH-ubiquinone oxidoreductase chain N (EC [uncultured Campylobacterales bacterium]|uniref:NADH-quinone oxidoreductase subunit N n=1 Tax=uncultured Campylobacterales bacterium TaxID=352960 RepID=A0A6S6S746_9BACT|nr:MAG: NADH-ubiquinone oxidoreductase chain N (EC [uncultured Campylobacterales bacterium]